MYGGRNQNRTGLDGFAIHCITDLLSGQGVCKWLYKKRPDKQVFKYGAGNEIRTRDIHVGNVMLYQLSYSRNRWQIIVFFR
jgi:hypothetical protein